MSKFDAIFNEIRSSEKNICEPVNLVHATQFFINVFFLEILVTSASCL